MARSAGRLGSVGEPSARELNGQDLLAPLVEHDQVLEQACRRVLGGESVPAAQKLVSLVQPHIQIIRRDKLNLPTEFGRKIWLCR